MLTLILTLLIVGIIAFLFTKSKTGKTLTDNIRYADDKISESVRDPEALAKIAIRDAENQLLTFTQKISSLLSASKGLNTRINANKNDVGKYEALAKQAGAAGNAEDVRAALDLKVHAEQNLASLSSDLAANTKLSDSLKVKATEYAVKIEDARNSTQRNLARIESANIRMEMAGNSLDASGLARLDSIEGLAEKATNDAEAKEEINGVLHGDQSLEAKYTKATVSDDDVAKYLAK